MCFRNQRPRTFTLLLISLSVKMLFVFPVQLDYFLGMVETENTGWEGTA